MILVFWRVGRKLNDSALFVTLDNNFFTLTVTVLRSDLSIVAFAC